MIRKATPADASAAAGLALLLWNDHQPDELTEEFSDLISRNDCAVFLCYDGEEPVGFAQCQLRRDYVEGTSTCPVGYLEGIFVREEFRSCGHARKLLRACEEWAVEMGCTEFASDCELSNETSLRFHLKVGFVEANRIICFTKPLSSK